MKSGKIATAAIIAASLLAGCAPQTQIESSASRQSGSSEKESGYEVNSSLTSDEITLMVWESVNGPDEWIKKAGEEFNKLYPNIHIQFHNVEIDDCLTYLTGDMGDNPVPDLFGAPSDALGKLVENNLVLPIENSSFVTMNTLYTAATAMNYNDIMYGYPTSCETYALFYNKKLISEDKLPKTWEALVEWGKAFNEVYADCTAFVYRFNTMYYSSMLMTRDNNFIMQKENLGLTGESAKYGMELLVRLKEIMPENMDEFEDSQYDADFLGGNIAMTVNGPWFVPSVQAAELDYGVAPLPGFEDGSNTYSFSGVRGMFIHAATKHPKEAEEFAKFLVSEDMQKLRMEITGAMPCVNIEVDADMEGFVEQLQYSYMMPSDSYMDKFWEMGTELCLNIYGGEDITEQLTLFNDAIMALKDPDYVPSTACEESGENSASVAEGAQQASAAGE